MNKLHNKNSNRTSISLNKDTKAKLARLGSTSESYDALISRLVNHVIEEDKD